MFKSQLTGKQYGPGVKPVRVVVATRPKTYIEHGVVVGTGTEIVKEMVIGPDEVDKVVTSS